MPTSSEYDKALDRALRLLTERSRSRSELKDRLLRAGFPEETAARVEGRLVELGLIDDIAFAKEAVEYLIDGRGMSLRMAESELQRMGVDGETALGALAGLETSDLERAGALARRRMRSYSSIPKGTAYRRLANFLARRGYEQEVAHEVCSRLLGIDGELAEPS